MGQQQHPDVPDAISPTFQQVREAGKLVGINAFNLEHARQYVDAGASFVCIGADVQQLAGAVRGLVDNFKGDK